MVTPYAGVWIEIEIYPSETIEPKSLPTRECGLKFAIAVLIAVSIMSLPTRECGLKCTLLLRQNKGL